MSKPPEERRRMSRLDNIDIRLLRIFVAIVDAKGFVGAQVSLNLAQPTLSTHLTALERKLGGTLCERGRSGFRVTSFGESVYNATKQLFEDIESFQFRINKDQKMLSGRLRIGIVDGAVTNPKLALQRALDRYMTYAERVFIEIELGSPLDLERALMEGQHDVIIGPFTQKSPTIKYIPLCRERHVLYCGKDHPLFKNRNIRHADIESALFSVRGYHRLDDLYRVGLSRASAAITHMEAQLMLILSGRFIGFLPKHIGDPWADRGELRQLKPEAYSLDSQHFLATRHATGAARHVDAFVTEMKALSA